MTRKKKGGPFGFDFWDDDFEDIMDEMNKMVEGLFGRLDDVDLEKFEKMNKPYVYGMSVRVGPEGKPIIRRFGDLPGKEKKAGEREPLVDVIEEKKIIKVIVELPGVSKNDINLKGAPDSLEIKVDTPDRKYFKLIRMPAKIKALGAKANYKNGVLEIIIEREKEKREEKKGHSIKIE